MFALKAEQGGRIGVVKAALDGLLSSAGCLSSGHFILPRWLRRPARLVSRMCDGEYSPPRYFGVAATAAFLSVSALYGAWYGGHMPAVAQTVTARLGFAVDQIRVSGN